MICTNCGTTDCFDTHMIDGAWIALCDDCHAEELRIEAEAERLAVKRGCDWRELIIDRAQSSREVVNKLVAHDQNCACTVRKPMKAAAAFATQEIA